MYLVDMLKVYVEVYNEFSALKTVRNHYAAVIAEMLNATNVKQLPLLA